MAASTTGMVVVLMFASRSLAGVGLALMMALGGSVVMRAPADAVDYDGAVVGWGDNYFGQAPGLTSPPAGTKFVHVAAGVFHSLGLTDAGTVVGWGYNSSYGQAPGLTSPPAGTKFVQVATDERHSLGLIAPADTTPPVVSVAVAPNPVLQHLTATATFTATDAESGIAHTTCPPEQVVATGEPGTFTLECSATNGAGLSNEATASYTVLTPTQSIDRLRTTVTGYQLGTMEKPLVVSLEGAMKNLDQGDTAGAVDKLASFIAKVNAQSGKKIPAEQAAELAAQAQAIIASLQAMP
jgi:hypothetical protein